MNKFIKLAGAVAIAFAVTACDDDDNDDVVIVEPPVEPPAPVVMTYEVTFTNLTANQPLSPPAAMTHADDFKAWMVGGMASVELETLAESGDVSMLTGLSDVSESVVSEGPLGPGASTTLELMVTEGDPSALTVVTMLVNTNDAFAGKSGFMLPMLANVGDSYSMNLGAYDAGTEANSETAATIPGPAGGGEGFNAARDDEDRIFVHPGVLSMYEMPTSALDASHRFDNPVMRVSVTRMQ